MITIKIDKSINLPYELSAFVSFQYNTHIVDAIKSLPFRYYMPDKKCWEISVDKIEQFKELVSIYDDIKIINDDLIKNDDELPKEFEYVTKPLEHQVAGIKYGMKHNNWILGDEMGLGKTFQAINIAIARKLKYNYKHCLIVCGVNTLKWNWVNEIKTHSREESWILGQKYTRNNKIKIGSTKDKLNDLNNIENLPYFIITNIESFRDENISKTIQDLTKTNIINMIVFDESHKAKNPQSQQSKGFMKCLPECKIAMTGTPLMNTPLDTYILLKWLGYEKHPFYSFKNHYCMMGGFGGHEIIGYRNLDELQLRLNEIMLRRKKEDVFDLPEKVYIDEYIEMTPKQQQLYREVETDIRLNIDLVISNPSPLSALIRLRQVTGYTGILSSIIQESAKLDRMEEIIEEAYSNNKKVVVFSNWTQITNAVYTRLANKYGTVVLTGETSDNVRQQKIDLFQNSDSCNVIVGTIGALGTGVTLTAGTIVIFIDHPWNRALYDQAVDRCHRIGQTNSITIYNLMCKDSIDERIWSIVKQKGDISDMIVDGKQMNKNDLVMYLLNDAQ